MLRCSGEENVTDSILDSGDPSRPGRPAKTYLIVSRNCARITSGGPIEPENFDRRKRRENGDVARSRIVSCLIFLYLDIRRTIFQHVV